MYTCGDNTYGQLADNTLTSKSSPVSIARSVRYSVLSRNTGGYHILTIDASDGSIWAFGRNNFGQLGINSVDNKSSPVSIIRPGSYKAVITSLGHSLAIDALDGSIWTWGFNSLGQLGDNSRSNKSSPISIVRSGSYSAIAAGTTHSLAIDASDGSIWSWGENTKGNFGDNSKTSKSSPISIARSGSYKSISAGAGYSLMTDSIGGIWSCGANDKGQLGDNSLTDQSSPVSIARPGSYSVIATGTAHSLAIDASDGSIWVWGSNSACQLGVNNDNIGLAFSSSPISIARPGSYIAIAGGTSHSLAIDFTGEIWAWGSNSLGQLGINSATTPISSPVSIARVGRYNQVSCLVGASCLLETSLNYFSQSSIVDGTAVQSIINGSALVSTIQSHYVDTFFDSVDKISRITVYYNHEDGRQTKRIIYEYPSLMSYSSWSVYAKDGTWNKNRIKICDRDGAIHDLPRTVIGTFEDIIHNDGTMNFNVL